MDILETQAEKYRNVIKQFITHYAVNKPSHGDIEIQTILDNERDHYQVVAVGWDGKQRVYGCAIHIDIKTNKIWLQTNNTEVDIAQMLRDLGVPKEDIVIGFQPPHLRALSGYAIA